MAMIWNDSMAKMQYYLSESCKGDGKAAYKAAKLMQEQGKQDFLVQKQYRRSAELGYGPAQSVLGMLALCGHLIEKESTYDNIRYNTDRSDAYGWFSSAAMAGDALGTYFLGKCYQLGIGTDKDEHRAHEHFVRVNGKITEAEVYLVMFFLDTLKDECIKLEDQSGYAFVTAIAS